MTPTELSMPSACVALGRRRSHSMSSVFWPVWARVRARFTDVVVFPSPGGAKETTKTLVAASMSTNWRLVRSTRKPSTRGACEASDVTSGSVLMEAS